MFAVLFNLRINNDIIVSKFLRIYIFKSISFILNVVLFFLTRIKSLGHTGLEGLKTNS